MQPARIHSLTSLRFFAAASVAVDHATAYPYFLHAFPNVFYFAPGVSFFFVLSGFILAHTYCGMHPVADFRSFIVARIARIWPVHLFTLALCVALWPTANAGFAGFLANTFLVHALVPYPRWYFSFNGVSWSISAELCFYVAFPFFLALVGRSWRGGLLLVAALLSGVLIASMAFGLPYRWSNDHVSAYAVLFIHPVTRFAEFAAGILTYVALRRSRHWATRSARVTRVASLVECNAVAVCATAILVTVILRDEIRAMLPEPLWAWLVHSGVGIAFAALIGVFALERGALSRALQNRVLVYLGEVSFALYMVHQLVLRVMDDHLRAEATASPALYYALYWGLTLLCAAALHELIEKPCRIFIRGLHKGAAARAAV